MGLSFKSIKKGSGKAATGAVKQVGQTAKEEAHKVEDGVTGAATASAKWVAGQFEKSVDLPGGGKMYIYGGGLYYRIELPKSFIDSISKAADHSTWWPGSAARWVWPSPLPSARAEPRRHSAPCSPRRSSWSGRPSSSPPASAAWP